MDPGAAELTERRAPPALVLFAVLWAAAAAFHVAGAPTNASRATEAALAVGLAAVVVAPCHPVAWALAAAAQLATVWSAAPVLANHWLVVGFVNVAVLAVVARTRDPFELWARFAPAARLCLLGFYVFAAVAKLNHDFFDPDVSCAPFYLRESADSLGFGALADPPRWVEWAAIFGTAATELAIPVLLVWRRTRLVGVVVALAFHGVLALDRTHEFYDFSSALLPLFLLFLPDRFAEDVIGWVRARLEPLTLRAIGLVLVVGPVALAAASRTRSTVDLLFEVGWWGWQAVALVSLAIVVVWVVRWAPERPTTRGAFATGGVVALVPVLVVLNGLTPYLEVKTAFGWNMYSNLRTVDGESNHYLVTDTWPLGDGNERAYEIVASDDPVLDFYRARRYALPERQLRAYLHDHPDVSVSYRRDGGPVVRLQRAADDPRLVRDVAEWERKLLVFRAIDLAPDQRCQDVYGPAG